ncbi:MAG: HNH endonuclease [Candidatus Gracilibacteria bacterium]|jgi:putative restriction endonuclease
MIDRSVIIGNLTWNAAGWTNAYVNPKAGHVYARSHAGHESLNFKFDKKNLDEEDSVYGFLQWTNPPKDFGNGGIVVFSSKNSVNNKNLIVGIYCDVKILLPPVETLYEGFEDGVLASNLRAKRALSMRFPQELDLEKYLGGKKRVGQIGFLLSDVDVAKQVIVDEIQTLSISGLKSNDAKKLGDIYKFITGEEYNFENFKNRDEQEQKEIEEKIKTDSEADDARYFANLSPVEPEMIELKGKMYKRDNVTISRLKRARGYKCQICGYFVLKRNGDRYIEAAHIKAKSQKGNEMPDNIIILCPNHHKEFDYGELKINEQTKDSILFRLNSKEYSINLMV